MAVNGSYFGKEKQKLPRVFVTPRGPRKAKSPKVPQKNGVNVDERIGCSENENNKCARGRESSEQRSATHGERSTSNQSGSGHWRRPINAITWVPKFSGRAPGGCASNLPANHMRAQVPWSCVGWSFRRPAGTSRGSLGFLVVRRAVVPACNLPEYHMEAWVPRLCVGRSPLTTSLPARARCRDIAGDCQHTCKRVRPHSPLTSAFVGFISVAAGVIIQGIPPSVAKTSAVSHINDSRLRRQRSRN